VVEDLHGLAPEKKGRNPAAAVRSHDDDVADMVLRCTDDRPIRRVILDVKRTGFDTEDSRDLRGLREAVIGLPLYVLPERIQRFLELIGLQRKKMKALGNGQQQDRRPESFRQVGSVFDGMGR
jgi:hypothetical protein